MMPSQPVDARCMECINYGAAYCDVCASEVALAHETAQVGGFMSYAGRLPVTIKRAEAERGSFNLPVWAARDDTLRIGLPVEDPQYSGDMRQIIMSVDELLAAVAFALKNKPC